MVGVAPEPRPDMARTLIIVWLVLPRLVCGARGLSVAYGRIAGGGALP